MIGLADVRAAYERDIAALIAKYPAQEQNRAHYAERAASMRLGTLSRRVRTKLHDFPRGTVVGYIVDGEQPIGRLGAMVACVAIFAPGLTDGATLTVVRADEVRPTCTRCEGTGAVRPHPTALVSVRCPVCG